MKISCWHRADYESDALWKLYAAEHKGVAICSTPERMRAAIQPFRLQPTYGTEDLWAGPVKYHDLMKVRLRAGKELYFCKHQAFSWELEIPSFSAAPGIEQILFVHICQNPYP